MLRLLLFFVCLLLSADCTLQRDSLLAFYYATGGPSWTTVWDTLTEPCDAPLWYGIGCTASIVDGLNLPSNNLSGTLTDLQLPDLLNMYVEIRAPSCLVQIADRLFQWLVGTWAATTSTDLFQNGLI